MDTINETLSWDHKLEVPIPMRGSIESLTLEPDGEHGYTVSVAEELRRVIESIQPELLMGVTAEEVVDNVLFSAVVLRTHTNAPMANCLRTAIIWYFG